MSIFQVHSTDTAPEQSAEVMAGVAAKFGYVPNIYGVLAESPSTIKAYTSLQGLLAETAFSPAEQQMMLMTISAFNDCRYCVAAHTGGARRAKLDPQALEAIRAGNPIEDAKLNALHAFTHSVVENRGNVSAGEIESFMAAGYSKQQALEVVLATALKTISNYANHFAHTPLDDAFQADVWPEPAA